MAEAEDEQADRGQGGPPAGLKDVEEDRILVGLEDHAGALFADSGEPRGQDRQHEDGGNDDFVGRDGNDVSEA